MTSITFLSNWPMYDSRTDNPVVPRTFRGCVYLAGLLPHLRVDQACHPSVRLRGGVSRQRPPHVCKGRCGSRSPPCVLPSRSWLTLLFEKTGLQTRTVKAHTESLEVTRKPSKLPTVAIQARSQAPIQCSMCKHEVVCVEQVRLV